jgi:hypothetical protein
MTAAVSRTMYSSYDTTDLSIPPRRDQHSAGLDVHYRNGSIPDSPEGRVVGLTSCQIWEGHRCDHWHVIFDGAQIADYSDAKLQWLACHETGHTVGLKHGSVDPDAGPGNVAAYQCMRYSPFPIYLGAHNATHINNHY